jgi:hypothetical protein
MQTTTCDPTNEAAPDSGPFVSETDVLGLCRPETAAAMASWTVCPPRGWDDEA